MIFIQIDFIEILYHVQGNIFKSRSPTYTGTSILDSRNTLFTNVENVYNRLIAYDGYNIHALTGCFGNSPKTDRLTIVFFIHEKALAKGFI